MSEIEQTYRRFLLVVAGGLFVGTVIELILAEHYQDAVQWIPFGLSAMGLLLVVWAWLRPQAQSFKALRYGMIVIAAGSLFGVYEHLVHNFGFELEIRPNATASQVLFDALAGANPLLAPGTLFLAALLAYAATYKHPLLTSRSTN